MLGFELRSSSTLLTAISLALYPLKISRAEYIIWKNRYQATHSYTTILSYSFCAASSSPFSLAWPPSFPFMLLGCSFLVLEGLFHPKSLLCHLVLACLLPKHTLSRCPHSTQNMILKWLEGSIVQDCLNMMIFSPKQTAMHHWRKTALCKNIYRHREMSLVLLSQ